MAITGTKSAFQDMKLLAKELVVDGVEIGGVAPATAIPDITVTGTYADDDDTIEDTVNGILAALRSHGIIASS